MAQENHTNQERDDRIVIIKQESPASNGLGTAGFILALIALFLSWVPILGWIIWFLGLLLSFIGMFKIPRGLAIAGFVISILGFVLLVAVVGTLVSLLGFY